MPRGHGGDTPRGLQGIPVSPSQRRPSRASCGHVPLLKELMPSLALYVSGTEGVPPSEMTGVRAAGHRAELTTALGCALAGSCPSGDREGSSLCANH